VSTSAAPVAQHTQPAAAHAAHHSSGLAQWHGGGVGGTEQRLSSGGGSGLSYLQRQAAQLAAPAPGFELGVWRAGVGVGGAGLGRPFSPPPPPSGSPPHRPPQQHAGGSASVVLAGARARVFMVA
jgi:hypothetical protein